jgi:hypothetical protein
MSKIFILIVIVIIITGGIFWWQKDNISNLFFGESPKACTQEAKLCPDGSYVGRTGPNCEFAPCPEAKIIEPIQIISLNSSIFLIGKNGGVIISPDGKMRLEIPIGALQVDAKIKLTVVPQSESGGNLGQVGSLYQIDPVDTEQLKFLKPAIMKIIYDPNDLPKYAVEKETKIGEVGDFDSWNLFDDNSIDTINHVVSVKISEIYANYHGIGVLPQAAEDTSN